MLKSRVSRFETGLDRSGRPMPVKDISDHPAAPRRLMICTGPCCDRTGAATFVLAELRIKLKDALALGDKIGEDSCVRRACLGKCTGEPLAYVEPEGIWYRYLSADHLLCILREHVLGQRPVESLRLDQDP